MRAADLLRRWQNSLEVAALVVLAYLPALTARPGQVVADTKLYLTLSPARLIADAPWTWDARQFGGWVPHQNVGYLWPSGPFFWFGEAIGLAPWVIQRLWIGSLLVAAGLGVRWCARLLGLAPTAALIAAAVYQLTPYVLPYISRTSVLLPPWSGLGWLVGLTALAAQLPHRRRWWPVAAFALVVATIGGINATAVLMIAPAPLLYLIDAARRRSIGWARAASTAAALGVAAAAVSLWWLAGLAVQGRYGAAALSYSEALESTAFTSSAPEVLRGLGYWLFYVRDHVVALTTAATPYMERPLVIAAGWLLVLAGASGLAFTNWRHRGFAATSVLVGVVLAVGTHPVGDPAPLWAPLANESRSTLVLALRSSTRAAPMIVLGLALGAGILTQALAAHRAWLGRVAALAISILAMLNLPALTTGAYADPALARDQVVSEDWRQAADEVAAAGAKRVLLIPGVESATFRWGYTVDPPWPGLSTTPLLTRDWLPLGSPGLMDLLYALDDRFQDGLAEPSALAPAARLLGADVVLVVNDWQFERFDTQRPQRTWAWYRRGVPGLGAPNEIGSPAPNVPTVPMVDDFALTRPELDEAMPGIAWFDVDEAARAPRATDRPVVVAGSGDGLLDAAAAGLLDGTEVVIYSAAVTAEQLEDALAGAAAVVVTDSNRARARQWRGSQDVWGFTEDGEATVLLVRDPLDHRLPMFPSLTLDQQTLAFQRGPVTATATGYGSPTRYWPEYRPWRAIDGDLTSSWLVGDEADPRGERLQLTAEMPLTQLTLVQHQDPLADRWVGSVVVTTDAGDRLLVPMDDRSRTATGQPIDLPQPAHVVTIEIADVANAFPQPPWQGSAVGFAEVLTGQTATMEVVRPPVDLVQAANRPDNWTTVLTRLRSDPFDRRRDDPEPALWREVTVPQGSAVLRATVRLSPRADDATLAALLGGSRPIADRRAAGGLAASGILAADGDPTTAWLTPFGHAVGSTLSVPRAEVPIDHLEIRQPTDREVASIAAVRLSTGDEQRDLAVPEPDATGWSRLEFPPLPPGTLTVTITGIDGATTVDRHTGRPVSLPAAVSEIRGPGIANEPLPDQLDLGCREDLLAVDGRGVPLRLSGELHDLIAGDPFTAENCGGTVVEGSVLLSAAPGRRTGLDVDRVVLARPGGEAASTEAIEVMPVGDTRTSRAYDVGPCPTGCWFVQGEGWSEGWTARTTRGSLGRPLRLGPGMNGWWLEPSGEPRSVEVQWTPQRFVWWGLGLSGAAVVAAIGMLLHAARTRDPLRTRLPGHDLTPSLALTMGADARRLPPQGTVLQAAGAGLFAGLVITPWWGVAVGALTTLAVVLRRRWILAVFSWSLLAMVGAYLTAHQVLHHPAAGFGWPLETSAAHRPALAAVVLLSLAAAGRRHEPAH